MNTDGGGARPACGGVDCWRGTKGVPRKGVWASVNVRAWTCKALRAKHDRTSCYLRPPFLGTPWVPSGGLTPPDSCSRGVDLPSANRTPPKSSLWTLKSRIFLLYTHTYIYIYIYIYVHTYLMHFQVLFVFSFYFIWALSPIDSQYADWPYTQFA